MLVHIPCFSRTPNANLSFWPIPHVFSRTPPPPPPLPPNSSFWPIPHVFLEPQCKLVILAHTPWFSRPPHVIHHFGSYPMFFYQLFSNCILWYWYLYHWGGFTAFFCFMFLWLYQYTFVQFECSNIVLYYWMFIVWCGQQCHSWRHLIIIIIIISMSI